MFIYKVQGTSTKVQVQSCALEMGKFKTILEKFIPKLSIKYLLFIFIIVIGCSYQIIHVSKVYFEFETKINVKYIQISEIVIPMVSICKKTANTFRDSSKLKSIEGMSSVQVYNETLNFDEVFIKIEFYCLGGKMIKVIKNFTDENQNEIQYEKTISSDMICYHFKYSNTKKLNNKVISSPKSCLVITPLQIENRI